MNELPNYTDLTDEQVATMCAEVMGWVNGKNQEEGYWAGTNLHINEPSLHECNWWNPRHSLDQCKVFQDWLKKNVDTRTWMYFWMDVRTLSMDENRNLPIAATGNATASQRCEAFLKTIGKVR